MRVQDAQEQLLKMLVGAGLDPTRLDPAPTWQIFKEFAAQAVEGTGGDPDDDMLLFEYGAYDWSDGKGERFNWSLCRQFTLYDRSGEYDHMEHLRCDLFFEPTSALEGTGEGTSMWPSTRVDEWALEVESMGGHKSVFGALPVESQFRQEEV